MTVAENAPLPAEYKVLNVDIFPIGSNAAQNFFSRVDKSPDNGYQIFEDEMQGMADTNPYALKYLYGLVDIEDPDEKDLQIRGQFVRGAVLLYGVMRERAGAGHAIPSLTSTFIETYDFINRLNDEKAEEEDEDPPQMMDSMDTQIPYKIWIKVNLFKVMEKDFFKTLGENFTDGFEYVVPTESAFHAGIATAYFLFREGLSDPDNYMEIDYSSFQMAGIISD